MVSDCAFEPRSAVASSVGIEKNQNTHKLDAYLKTGELFNVNVFRLLKKKLNIRNIFYYIEPLMDLKDSECL